MLSARIDYQVQFFDLDPMRVVWHGNYIRLFEQARCALFDHIGYNFPEMETSGYLFPIVDMRVKYLQSALFGQHLLTTASLQEYENRLKVEYLVTDRETADRICSGYTIQVAVERDSGEMLFRTPEFLIDRIARTQQT